MAKHLGYDHDPWSMRHYTINHILSHHTLFPFPLSYLNYNTRFALFKNTYYVIKIKSFFLWTWRYLRKTTNWNLKPIYYFISTIPKTEYVMRHKIYKCTTRTFTLQYITMSVSSKRVVNPSPVQVLDQKQIVLYGVSLNESSIVGIDNVAKTQWKLLKEVKAATFSRHNNPKHRDIFHVCLLTDTWP